MRDDRLCFRASDAADVVELRKPAGSDVATARAALEHLASEARGPFPDPMALLAVQSLLDQARYEYRAKGGHMRTLEVRIQDDGEPPVTVEALPAGSKTDPATPPRPKRERAVAESTTASSSSSSGASDPPPQRQRRARDDPFLDEAEALLDL